MDPIDAATRRLYGTQEPRQWRTLIAWSLGGPDPLDAVRSYEADGHWHFVSQGLGERGVELTFRLARRKGETAPPEWTVKLLQDVAREVVTHRKTLRPGDHVDLGRPIDGDDATAIRALAFVEDPDLPAKGGKPRFVQAVGVTADELDAIKDWSTHGVLELIARGAPKLVTDPKRRSIREDAANEATIKAGIVRDGSSHGASSTAELAWSRDDTGSLHLCVGIDAVRDLQRALRGRIPFTRPFRIEGAHGAIVLWPAGIPEPGDIADPDTLFVELTAEQAEAMHQSLDRSAACYRWPAVPGLTLEVTDVA